MTSADALNQLQAIMRSVFDDDGLEVRRETVAGDVPGWDSLTHIELVVAVERRFRIKFSVREIQGFRNVGDLCDAVAARG